MRKLHLVGYTPDHKGLIFSARRGSKSGGFVVAIGEPLLDIVAEEQRRRNGEDVGATAAGEAEPQPPVEVPDERGSRRQSTLTPREIQARLRSGRSIADVAAEAGVDREWVERFAVPILAEQAQIVELARSLVYVKPRRGESAEPLGASVAENLSDRGVALAGDAFDAAWSARQLHDAVWQVDLRYRSRGRDQQATWLVDVASGQLTSGNRLASDLGYLDSGQRRSSARPAASGPTEAEDPEPPRRPRRQASKTKRTSPGAAAAGGSRRRAPANPKPAKAGAATRPGSAPTKATKARASSPPTRGRSSAPRQPAAATPTRAGGRAATKATGGAGPSPRAAGKPRPAKASAPTRRSTVAPKPAKAAPRARSGGASAAPAAVAARRGRAGSRSMTAATKDPKDSNGAAAQPAPGRRPSDVGAQADGAGATAGQVGATRLPVNRLASSRVAANRAATGRLSGQRRAANPVPPPEDQPPLWAPRRRSRPQPSPQPSPQPVHGAAAARPMPAATAPPVVPPSPASPAPVPSPPPPPPPPPPRPPRVEPHDDGRDSAPSEPSANGLDIDELLESVDFEDRPPPDDQPPARPVISAPRVGHSTDGGSVATSRSAPLSAWPLGAG